MLTSIRLERSSKRFESGFTLIEMMVTITLVVMVGLVFFTIVHSNSNNYLSVQKDSIATTTLAAQANRVDNVLRGLTGIVSAGSNDLIVYAYFYPSDTYVSKLHYYISNGQLLVDLTQMTSNPPIGTPIDGSTKTYVIIPTFYQPVNSSLFSYFDSGNNTIATPVSDTNTIKSIQVNLASKLTNNANQQMSLQVSLRNRKTNL